MQGRKFEMNNYQKAQGKNMIRTFFFFEKSKSKAEISSTGNEEGRSQYALHWLKKA